MPECQWEVSTDGTGVAISKEMNVCTHAPNFYDNEAVVSECKSIKDKQACLDTGRCLFNDCQNTVTAVNTATSSTSAPPAPAAGAFCPANQQCKQFNGDHTPGTCLNINDPPVPVSYKPNSCTHQSYASEFMYMTNLCAREQNKDSCEASLFCKWNGDVVDCPAPNTAMKTDQCGAPDAAFNTAAGTANYNPSSTAAAGTANYPSTTGSTSVPPSTAG